MNTIIPAKTDVLIIGGGPTGLTLAASLAQAGVDHVIIDKLAEGHTTSRAAVVHAHTLEALDGLGVADRLALAGLKVGRFSIRDRDTALVRLSFDHLPSAFSYLLMVPQDVTEAILLRRLEEFGGTLHRGVVAEAIEAAPHGVRVWLTTPEGRRAIDARYVVGADGVHSMVRETAGIPFEGNSYTHSFVLADVTMEWAHGRDEVMLFFSSAGPVVVAPLPSGRFRIVAAVENAPEKPQASDVQAVLDASGPSDGAHIVDVHWSSRFRIHHRLARHYRRGRLLLMGDAAHAHSPAGGQGMNTGIVDAIVLARLLSDVLHGKRNDSRLNIYERLRRPAAERVLRLANDLTEMAMKSGPIERGSRNFRLAMVDHLAPAKHRLIMNLSGLSRRNAAKVPA